MLQLTILGVRPVEYDKLKTVIVAVIKLCENWQLTNEEKLAIVGFDLENAPLQLSSEQEQRLSLLLNIHACLRYFFSNPDNIYGYMTMVNHDRPYCGQRPVDLACANFEGLKMVNDALRQLYSS